MTAEPLPPALWDNVRLQLDSHRGLARAISLVENNTPGYLHWLSSLSYHNTPVIGITGPPGAGKSSLVNALVSHLLASDKKTGIIAVDPTSPFHHGSLLGDRVRMGRHFTNPDVFIRSLATRGSLGGLSAKAIEITDVMRAAGFDYILVETVGVGQSEVEIAGLADVTLVVLVPEAGDEIQGLKSGIMEIADIFVVNKADRPGADVFIANLKRMVKARHLSKGWQIPVLPSVATEGKGIPEIMTAINGFLESENAHSRRATLFAEKAWQLIMHERMKSIDRAELEKEIGARLLEGQFNLYEFIRQFVE